MQNIKSRFEDNIETMVDTTMYHQLIESIEVTLERELGRKLWYNDLDTFYVDNQVKGFLEYAKYKK
jgi:hypothetical protein